MSHFSVIPGEIPPAVKWNQIGSWTAYTPALTNLTLGNGTRAGRWTRVGALTVFQAEIVLGSTSVVTGQIGIGPPPQTPLDFVAHGSINADFVDSSALKAYPGIGRITNTPTFNRVDLCAVLASGTYAEMPATSASIPFVFATGDQIRVSGWYFTPEVTS
jgi:hypothetical protein